MASKSLVVPHFRNPQYDFHSYCTTTYLYTNVTGVKHELYLIKYAMMTCC